MIADLSQGRTPRQISGKDGASACATLVERTTRYLITRGPASGAQGRPGLLRAHTPHPRPTRGCDANTDMGPRPRNGPPPAPHPRHWRGGVFRSPPQKHSTNSLLPPIDTAPPSQIATRQILGVVATPFTMLTTHQNAPEAYPSLTSYAADH